jgi:DnaK suppressor protein
MIRKEISADNNFNGELSNAQKQILHDPLVSLRQKIMKTWSRDIQAADQQASDPVDRAQAESLFMLQIRMRSMQSDLLSEVNQALQRMEQGNYGFCEVSGRPIEIGRLLAQPTTRMTVEEQTRIEKMELF